MSEREKIPQDILEDLEWLLEDVELLADMIRGVLRHRRRRYEAPVCVELRISESCESPPKQ
jgi:hypothetical protein